MIITTKLSGTFDWHTTDRLWLIIQIYKEDILQPIKTAWKRGKFVLLAHLLQLQYMSLMHKLQGNCCKVLL